MFRAKLSKAKNPKRVLVYALRYAFGLVDKLTMLKSLSPADGLLAEELCRDGDFLKNGKLYLYAYVRGKNPVAYQYGVTEDDASLLRCCVPYLKGLDLSRRAYSLKEMDTVTQCLFTKPISDWMGKFISKKLRFLVMSYGVSVSDLREEMLYAGILAIYKTYPHFESPLHAINIAKRSMHNAAFRLVSYHTKACRNALYQEPDGQFQSKLVPWDALSNDLRTNDLERREAEETRQSIRQLLGQVEPKHKRFLDLALGTADKEFSVYLGIDNDDAVHSMPYKRYLTAVSKFLGLSATETKDCFSQCAQLLGG